MLLYCTPTTFWLSQMSQTTKELLELLCKLLCPQGCNTLLCPTCFCRLLFKNSDRLLNVEILVHFAQKGCFGFNHFANPTPFSFVVTICKVKEKILFVLILVFPLE